MAGDVREFVESCLTCQLERADHTLREASLLSLTILEVKWKEVSINFIMNLLEVGDVGNLIMTVVDRFTKMVHLIPCKKSTTVGEEARLYWQRVVKLH